MNKKHIISKYNITLDRDLIQLKLNFNTDFYVEDDIKLKLIHKLIDMMDLSFIIKTFSKKGRKNAVDPISMLKILIYAYSEGIYSVRKIEKLCKYDLRIINILDGTKAPNYSTINRFRQKISPFIEDVLNKFNEILISNNHIDLSSIYIDGTKVEAYANKYTFVWKKSVLKYRKRLKKKIIKHFGFDENTRIDTLEKKLKEELREKKFYIDKLGIVFVYGKGKRKTDIQREYELLSSYLNKLIEYRTHLEIMGERNSYSKTDHDATFMRMKDDYMRNGQLKAGYNIQMATTGNFIIGVYGSHHPSDMYTLPLFIDKLSTVYDDSLDKIVCDAGYESEENYVYLENKNLRAFIKPSNYEISKTRKYKKAKEYRDSLIYDKEKDTYTDYNNKVFVRLKDRHRTKKSGYVSSSRVYKCFDWNTNNQKTKSIYFTDKFEILRKKSLENITSSEGINERINRSIQAEGVFSKLKEGLKYNRFRHRGIKNVLSEMNLMALAINFNVLEGKILRNIDGIIKYSKVS